LPIEQRHELPPEFGSTGRAHDLLFISQISTQQAGRNSVCLCAVDGSTDRAVS
jgi:hypothetical protein